MLRYFVCLCLSLIPPSRCFWLRHSLLRISGIYVAEDAKVCGHGFFYGRGKVTIGKGTWVSPRVIFYTNIENTIEIGAQCDIGPDVKFVCGSHVIGNAERRAAQGISDDIVIGDGCWIGANVLCLAGAKIGPGSVVAAGSVVKGQHSDNTLIAGVPAKFKKQIY